MRKIQLDSVLLFAFVIPFIMTYGLSAFQTPYWLFGIIFLSLLFYLVLDLLGIKKSTYYLFKQILFWLIVIEVIGSSFSASVISRHRTAPIYTVHDIILQQEAAMRFFLEGKNPYAVTYFGTPLEDWHYSDTEVNPALYHFVMQPLYLLFALPFYFISNRTIGYFDGRIPLLFLFISMLVMAMYFMKDKQKRLLFLTIIAFNPAMLGYTLEGRSDMFMLPFLFLSLIFLHKRRFFFAGIVMACAFAIKQSVWPILPFYIAFLYFNTKSVKETIKNILGFIAVYSLFTVPFLVWDFKAFLESTVFYLSGNVPNSYPVSGYGLGMILKDMGIIKDPHAYYSFVLWQAIIGVPLLIGLLRYLYLSPRVNRLIIVYGIFLIVFWYLSRYFNNSHLVFLSMIFAIGYFWPDEE